MAISNSQIVFGAKLQPETFSLYAQEKASEIFLAGCKKDRDGSLRLNRAGKPEQEANSSSQLRKFYDELVMWHDKVVREQSGDLKARKLNEILPFVKMLNAKVAYARARKHVDPCFEKLFTHVIRQIDSPDTLKHAKLFMEAFMGFYKAEEK
jgi:CRISPR-associated protein Csm2